MAGSGRSCGSGAEAAGDVAQTADDAVASLRRHFRRVAARRHAADYLRGLLADVERKNGRQLAERIGGARPRGIQRALARYAWDPDAVRDDLRAYGAAALGDPGGIFAVDETGLSKQGAHSAGVARQYRGTLGKVANCQAGVVLGDAGPHGHAAIDRALFVPQEWFADPARCREAAIAEAATDRTKPQLALAMLGRPGGRGARAESSPTRSTAATGSCGGRWKRAGKPTGSPAAATRCPRPGHRTGRRGRPPSPPETNKGTAMPWVVRTRR